MLNSVLDRKAATICKRIFKPLGQATDQFSQEMTPLGVTNVNNIHKAQNVKIRILKNLLSQKFKYDLNMVFAEAT